MKPRCGKFQARGPREDPSRCPSPSSQTTYPARCRPYPAGCGRSMSTTSVPFRFTTPPTKFFDPTLLRLFSLCKSKGWLKTRLALAQQTLIGLKWYFRFIHKFIKKYLYKYIPITQQQTSWLNSRFSILLTCTGTKKTRWGNRSHKIRRI